MFVFGKSSMFGGPYLVKLIFLFFLTNFVVFVALCRFCKFLGPEKSRSSPRFPKNGKFNVFN